VFKSSPLKYFDNKVRDLGNCSKRIDNFSQVPQLPLNFNLELSTYSNGLISHFLTELHAKVEVQIRFKNGGNNRK